MKSPFILLTVLIAAGFTSCSVYKSGQTPDDVYYSPERTVVAGGGGDDYVDVRERQSSRYQSSSRYNNYNDDYYYDDDAYLRMRVRNPYAYSRWNMFDNYWNDWGYYGGYGSGMSIGLGWNNYYSPWNNFYNPWYGYGGWNHGLNSYYYWNNFYNPYCGGGVVVVNPKDNPAMYTKVRNFNMSSYNSGSYNNRNNSLNSRTGRSSYRLPSGIGVYNNTNRTTTNSYRSNNSGGGGRYYNTRGNSDRPNRTYTPPSNNTGTYERSSGNSTGGSRGGSSGGSSGGGGGVSRPGRN